MSGKGRCVDKPIGRTIAYLLRCPRSTVPEAMRACKFSDKESMYARKQMAVHRADSNATTNQQMDQQKWVVVVAAIVTATAAATTATRQRHKDATTQRRNDATTNQQRDQQKWAVVVVAIATTTAAGDNGNNGDDSNTAAWWQRNGDSDGRRWTVRGQHDINDGK